MNVLLLFGGQSHEHEVSLISGAHVLDELNKLNHKVYTVAVHKNGIWHLCSTEEQLAYLKSHNSLFIPSHNPSDKDVVWTVPSKGIWRNIANPEQMEVDCVVPIIHGYSGEDGLIQGLLELADIPCGGCDATASAMCMNKHVTKLILKHFNIPITPSITVKEEYFVKDEEKTIEDCIQQLSLPLITKPTDGGSSVGICAAHTKGELLTAFRDSFMFADSVVVEPYLKNIREIEASVINKGNEVASFPPGEIVIPSKQIYDYSLKYHSNHAYAQIPAQLPQSILGKIQKLSEEVFIALGCSGFARIDFFLTEDDTIYVNEINTIPGFTPISMFPKMVKQELTIGELLNYIIDNAILTHKARKSKQVII